MKKILKRLPYYPVEKNGSLLYALHGNPFVPCAICSQMIEGCSVQSNANALDLKCASFLFGQDNSWFHMLILVLVQSSSRKYHASSSVFSTCFRYAEYRKSESLMTSTRFESAQERKSRISQLSYQLASKHLGNSPEITCC